jgi:uncharacterized protein YajQ (UPF0234 family)
MQPDIKFRELESELYNKEQQVTVLTQQDASCSDAIDALSEQVIKLTREIEFLKNSKQSRK